MSNLLPKKCCCYFSRPIKSNRHDHIWHVRLCSRMNALAAKKLSTTWENEFCKEQQWSHSRISVTRNKKNNNINSQRLEAARQNSSAWLGEGVLGAKGDWLKWCICSPRTILSHLAETVTCTGSDKLILMQLPEGMDSHGYYWLTFVKQCTMGFHITFKEMEQFFSSNCETQPSSIHWLSSSIFLCLSSFVRPASVTSPFISTIWCSRPYKPYIFC